MLFFRGAQSVFADQALQGVIHGHVRVRMRSQWNGGPRSKAGRVRNEDPEVQMFCHLARDMSLFEDFACGRRLESVPPHVVDFFWSDKDDSDLWDCAITCVLPVIAEGSISNTASANVPRTH